MKAERPGGPYYFVNDQVAPLCRAPAEWIPLGTDEHRGCSTDWRLRGVPGLRVS